MSSISPLKKSKEEYQEFIAKITLPDSPVGIDAQLTHAIIIDYLEQISQRMSRIEEKLDKIQTSD